jgi:5-methylcytosine-specific restriction endonuclease McrA
MMSYQVNRVRGKQRDAIFAEDGYKCAYCLLDLTSWPRVYWTIDHIKPRVYGGTNARSNLISACHGCNPRRRHTLIHDFLGSETLLRLVRDYPRVATTILDEMKADARELPTNVTRIA